MDHHHHHMHDPAPTTPGSGDMGHMDHMEHSMGAMAFHTGYTETVLFEQWKFSTIGGLIGSMVGIFFLAAIYEGLKYYREYLFYKTYSSLQFNAITLPDGTEVANRIPKPRITSPMHFYQTGLHMVQMTLSYFLMLIFMTYNVWLCLAVIVGAGTGFFLFGWKKSTIVDVTEHCH